MQLNNAQNVIGMAAILASSDPSVDVDAIEKEITNGRHADKKVDTSNDFAKQLNELDQLLTTSKSSMSSGGGGSGGYGGGGSGSGGSGGYGGGSGSGGYPSYMPSGMPSEEDFQFKTGDKSDSDSDSDSDSESDGAPAWGQPRDTQLAAMTQDAKKTHHVATVLNSRISDEENTLLNEDDEDEEMYRMIEKIDQLRTNLESEGIDLSRVPEVSHTSNKREIKSVLRILQIKNDRARYCDLFEEGMLGLAMGLENIFNGEREVLGSKIDLTGYSDTMKVKLKRMRYETSSFIGGIMEGSNISPGMRILLELVPSLFLYTRNRRVSSTDSLATDTDYKNAMQSM